MMWRRLGLVFVVITLLYFFSMRSVSAHANLSRSNPPANASLTQSPAEIRLWFTETLRPEQGVFLLTSGANSGLITSRNDNLAVYDAGDLSIPMSMTGIYLTPQTDYLVDHTGCSHLID